MNYLGVLEVTGAVHVLRPFAKHPQREIIAMPKVYGFDTGFVCFQRGWRELRPEDLGLLWEHVVLDELMAAFGKDSLFYWRDKQKREVDFVLARRGQVPIAIECKWRAGRHTDNNFAAMRLLHPEIRCMVVAGNGGTPRKINRDGTLVTGLEAVESAVERLSGP